MNPINPAARALALLALLVITACGGQQQDNAEPDELFNRDGQPSALARQPPPGTPVRTQAGLYATPSQLEWQLLLVQPYTAVIEVDQHATPQEAIQTTLASFRSFPEGSLAAFYVRGADLRQAAAVADGLTAGGMPNVFLVLTDRR